MHFVFVCERMLYIIIILGVNCKYEYDLQPPYYTSSSSLPPHTIVRRIIRSLQYTYILLTTSPPPPTTTAAARDIHKSNQDELPIQYPSLPLTYPNMPHTYISSSYGIVCAGITFVCICLWAIDSKQDATILGGLFHQSINRVHAALTHPPNN